MTGGFSEDAIAFRDLVHEVLEKECSPDRLRADLAGTSDPRRRWAVLADLGLFATTVPEDLGGLGFDDETMVLIAEEIGDAAVPEPVVETVSIVVPLLVRHAPRELQEEWLPRIATGDAIATVQLDGMPTASYGQFADLAILGSPDGLRLAVLTDADRLVMESEDFARHPAAITAQGVAFGDGAAVREAHSRGAVFTAAILNGASRRLLDMSVEYAKDRQQFNTPIGTFQAVQHMLADIYTELESNRPSAWHAARALARGDADVDVLGARRQVARQSWGQNRQLERAAGARRHRVHVGAQPAHLDEARARARGTMGLDPGAAPPARRRRCRQ